jgi:hypothetical protein
MAHDAGDLARLHLAQGAGDDAEVLAEGGHLHVSDIAIAGNHAVGGQHPPGHSEVGRAVRRVQTEFLESALGKQRVEALASRQQALGMQRFQLLGTDVVGQPVALGAQLFDQLRSYRHLDFSPVSELVLILILAAAFCWRPSGSVVSIYCPTLASAKIFFVESSPGAQPVAGAVTASPGMTPGEGRARDFAADRRRKKVAEQIDGRQSA